MQPRATRRATLAFVAVLSLVASVPAGAEDQKRLDEEILEILRDEGKIDEERYRELKEKEAREAAAREAEDVPPVSTDPDGWTIKYSNGLQFNKNDGMAKVKIGGRIQADFATIHTEQDLDNAVPGGDGEGTEFRRARLYMSGELYKRIIWKAQYNFTGGDVGINDLYIGMKGLGPLGTVKVGQMKEPFSLEELTSSKYITFMERALPSIFDSDRNTGVMFQNAPCDKRMTWALGIFADTDGGGEFFTSDTNFNVTGRMTGLPLYQDDGRQLIHLGVSAGYRFEDHIERRFRQRPEVHLAQRYLDTGTFVADGSTLLSAEAAGVFGPLHVSGEWKQVWIDGSGMRNTTGYGGYAQAGYFLTGEHRAYKKSAAAWGRTKPNNPFDPKNDKWGAFEIAGRYSYLNLNSADLDGGKEQNATFGANWYLFSNVRLSMNYVYANVRSTGAQLGLEGGDIHTFQARAQLEF